MRKIPMFLLTMFVSTAVLHARVNFIDEAYPGIDLTFSASRTVNDVSFTYSRGDDLKSMDTAYSAFKRLNPFLEVGLNWGITNINPEKGKSRTGPGDIALGMKYNILRKVEIGVKDPIILTEAKLTLPTGDSTKGIGTGGYGIGINLITGIFFNPFIGSGNIGYTVYTRGNNRRKGSELTYSANVDFPFADDVNIIAGIKGKHSSDDERNNIKISNSTSELYVAPGIILKLDDELRFNMNILIGLTKDSADLMLYAGMEF